jgi:hypothetical protein
LRLLSQKGYGRGYDKRDYLIGLIKNKNGQLVVLGGTPDF